MFRKKTEPVREAINKKVKLPNGVIVETEAGFFYIKNDVRLKVPNEKVLASWRVVNVPLYTESAMSGYPILNRLPYRDGTVVENFADKKVYYVSGGKLRHITNPDWYEYLNVNDNDVTIVSQEEIDSHKLGEPLD